MKLETSLDIDYLRSDFPILKQSVNGNPLVYLDSGASAQKPQVVIDAVMNCYTNYYSNVHRGIHELSQVATNQFEEVRKKLQHYINAKHEYEVIYTSGTTDSINLLAKSFAKSFLQAGDEIIISEMEHHANIVPWQMVCEEYDTILKVVPVFDTGELNMDEYKNMLSSKTKLVSFMHVSNVLGTINPVNEIIELAHDAGALVHLDGAQAVPHQQVDVQALNVDFYSFSGHKLFAPTGTGVLYGKEDYLEKMPPVKGGGSMIKSVSFQGTTYNSLPFKFEPGTPNIAEFIGFGAAIDYVNNIGLNHIANYENELTKYATEQLSSIEELRMIGTAANKAPVFSFDIDGIHSFDIGTMLNEFGIAVRTGHHCCQPLLQRMGVEHTTRASLAFYNTKDEIDFLVEKLNTVKMMLK